MKTFSFFWGFLLALVGLVFLGVNLDWISSSIWITLGQFWPVLLILLGIFLIIRSALIILGIAIVATLALGILIDRGVIDQKSVSVPWLTNQIEETSIYEKSVTAGTESTIDLELSGSTEVVITATDSNEVVVKLEGPKSQVVRYELETQGNSIRLTRRTSGNWTFDWWNDRITGTISIPKSLALELDITGASDVTLENHVGALTADVSGASQLTTKSMSLKNPDLTFSGASTGKLEKVTGTLSVEVSGASRVTFREADIESLTTEISGASKLAIDRGSIVSLSGEITGASNLRLPTPKSNTAKATVSSKIELTD